MLELLNLMPINGTPFRDEYLDDHRETPFHVITKYRHTSNIDLMIRIANVLIEKKFTASMQDMDGHLAIDYISEERQKPLYDVFVKITWSKLYSTTVLVHLVHVRYTMVILHSSVWVKPKVYIIGICYF